MPLAIGHYLGALVSAISLIGLGEPLRAVNGGRTHLTVFAIALCTALCLYALLPSGSVIQSHWQVPSQWRYFVDPSVTALGYGFLLGMGVLTYVVTPAMWSLVIFSLLGSPSMVLLAWGLYATVRFARLAYGPLHTDVETSTALFNGLTLRLGSLAVTLIVGGGLLISA